MMNFEWDDAKARTNLSRHGVSFDEAESVFGDPLSIDVPDPLHSDDEDRFIAIGFSKAGRLLVVVHSESGEVVRIISAREGTRREREKYEEERT